MEFFKKNARQTHSVDDLILLRKFTEAEELLRQELREHSDPQLRLKLGDVLRQLGRGEDAIAEYLGASDGFLENGFTDRARAAATRARKISPQRADIEGRFARMDRRKRLDMIRSRAVEALGAVNDDDERTVGKLEVERTWDLLGNCDWIHQLPDRQLIRILRGMQVSQVGAGKRIVAEGSQTRSLLLIVSGEVEARRIGPRGMVALRSFGPGDILGEKALLDRSAWEVTLVAQVDSRILVLGFPGFERALVGNEDPRGLIDGLRSQRNDEEVARLVGRL